MRFRRSLGGDNEVVRRFRRLGYHRELSALVTTLARPTADRAA
jgi:hypothetical protein